MKRQSFFAGAVILTVSSVISKIIGAIYKIPLTHLLGPQGMGIYYIIFPVYAFLITFVSTSYTLSVSRMVSSGVAKGDMYMARKTLYASLFLLTIIGFILCSVLILLSRMVADLQGVENAHICYLAIAPAIIMVGMSSSFKGYFQGLQNMTPSAISQVLEQVVKLSVGFTLASILMRHGSLRGTMGAIIGITVAEVVSLVFFIIYFFIYRSRNPLPKRKGSERLISLSYTIFKNTFPFILTSIISPLSLMIDSFLIVNILRNIGFDKYFATALLGLNGGVVSTLVNLPTTLSSSICITIIPYITYSLSKGDYPSVSEKASLAIKVTMAIAIPCSVVFLLFSPHIISLLYSSGMTGAESNISISLLTLASFNVIYISLLQISTALLQAISLSYVPVISLSLSLAVKIVLEVSLVSIANIGIYGAVLSAGISYAISAIICLAYLMRHMSLSISPYRSIIAPLISSIAMCLVIFATSHILSGFMSHSLIILSSLFTGGMVYVVMLLLTRSFTKVEIQKVFRRKELKKA